MRSVVEAVAFTFADAVDAFAAADVVPQDLLAIGGGTRSDFLLQTISNVTECRIGKSSGSDVGPAVGAARLACIAAGGKSVADVATKPEVERWFEPEGPVHDGLAQRLWAFRALYPALSGVQNAAG